MKRILWRWLVAAAVTMSVCGALAGAATAAAAPVLGLTGTISNSSGFGQVRPSQVNYGGDPTSFIRHVHWSFWGGKRAIGHGVANWVWPGWDTISGATPLPAEVIAYGLGNCGGVRAYQHVTWFWPDRGMTFRARYGGENLCTGKSPPYHPTSQDKVNHCGREQIGRPEALATDIQAYGGAGCGTARRFLRTHQLMRSLTTATKAHIGRWWCGSQAYDAILPTSYACVRGNSKYFTAQLGPG